MFTSLPREVSLADDGVTVHVKPPVELLGLRAGPATTTTLPSLGCGNQTSLGSNVSTADFEVLLNVSKMTAGDELASPGMEEAVWVGYDGGAAFVDILRNSSQNASAFQSSFRGSNVVPLPRPASGVLLLHVFLDHTVIELLSDCPSGPGLAGCDCRLAVAQGEPDLKPSYPSSVKA